MSPPLLERASEVLDRLPLDGARKVWRHRQAGAPIRYLTTFVGAYLALYWLLRHNRPPFGIFLYGGVLGLLYAMVAFGLILIYRANRIINFAIAEMGSLSAVLAVLLMKSRVHLPYVPALLLALACGALAGFLVEVLIIRRFARAPRLILMVATIGIGLMFAALQFWLPKWITGRLVSPDPPKTPFTHLDATIGGFHFNANALVVVVGVGLVVVGLSLFFRLTDVGLAVRASAENADRAALLGIPVKRVSTIVWIIASAMAALGVFLRAPVVGLPVGVLVGPQVLLFGLTAAVAGRMEKFTTALVTAVMLGVLEQTLYSFSGNPSIASAVVLPILLALMLFQRSQLSRGMDTGVATWSLAAEFRPVPPELRRVPEVQWGQAVTKGLILAGVVLVPFVLDVFRQNIASVILLYAIVGVSLVILSGWAGQISLGQWAFGGIGAATASGLATHHHADFFVAIVVAGIVGAIAAVVIGLPALRIQGLDLAVTTLAFALAVQVYVLSPNYASWLLPDRSQGIKRPLIFGRFDLANDRSFYWFVVIVLALALLSARALRNSRSGRVLIAARDNPRGAQSYGISLARARLTAFAISGFWAAVAGGLFAYHQGSIDTQAFDPQISLLVLIMVVIGGLTSLPGAVLGAIYIGYLRYYVSGPWQLMGSGVGVLILLMILPGGLAQLMYSVRDSFLRWVAQRRGIHVPSLVADRRVVGEEEVAAQDRAVIGAATTEVAVAGNGHRATGEPAITCPRCGERVPVDAVLEHDHFVGEPV